MIFFVVLALISNNYTKTLDQTKDNFYETKELVEKIDKLKKEWENSTFAKSKIGSFLNTPKLKALEPKISKSAKITKIEIKKVDKELIRQFVNDILISPVIIQNISIKKIDENLLDLEFEVQE
jgi:hypothetical protein